MTSNKLSSKLSSLKGALLYLSVQSKDLLSGLKLEMRNEQGLLHIFGGKEREEGKKRRILGKNRKNPIVLT